VEVEGAILVPPTSEQQSAVRVSHVASAQMPVLCEGRCVGRAHHGIRRFVVSRLVGPRTFAFDEMHAVVVKSPALRGNMYAYRLCAMQATCEASPLI